MTARALLACGFIGLGMWLTGAGLLMWSSAVAGLGLVMFAGGYGLLLWSAE